MLTELHIHVMSQNTGALTAGGVQYRQRSSSLVEFVDSVSYIFHCLQSSHTITIWLTIYASATCMYIHVRTLTYMKIHVERTIKYFDKNNYYV